MDSEKEPTLWTLNQPDRLWSLAMVYMAHDEDRSLADALEMAARELMNLTTIEWNGEPLTAEEVREAGLSPHFAWMRRAKVSAKTLIVTVRAVQKT